MCGSLNYKIYFLYTKSFTSFSCVIRCSTYSRVLVLQKCCHDQTGKEQRLSGSRSSSHGHIILSMQVQAKNFIFQSTYYKIISYFHHIYGGHLLEIFSLSANLIVPTNKNGVSYYYYESVKSSFWHIQRVPMCRENKELSSRSSHIKPKLENTNTKMMKAHENLLNI